MVESIVVVVIAVKVLVWTAAVINMEVAVEVLVIDVRAEVIIDTLVAPEIIVVAAAVSALEFAVSISYFLDVLSDMVVAALTGALTGVIIDFVSGIILDVLPGIGVEVLTDANAKAFEFPMTALEFVVSKLLEGFSC